MDRQLPDFNEFSMDLTLEQKFQMRIFQESIEAMNSFEARSLLLEASKLLMVKDNIIKGLMNQQYIQ